MREPRGLVFEPARCYLTRCIPTGRLFAKEKKVTLRTAALMRGIGRVKEAKHVRGVFP
jgi:hypothetical protein